LNNLIKKSFAFFTDSPASARLRRARAPSLMPRRKADAFANAHKGGLGWVRNSFTEILKNYTIGGSVYRLIARIVIPDNFSVFNAQLSIPLMCL